MDLDIFGRSATDKVSSQKNVTMLRQIICASALPGKMGNTKIAFFTRCISALPEFNQLLLDFFNLDFFSLFDSRLIVMLLSDSLNLVINVFSYGLLGGHGSGERKSRVLQQLDMSCTHKAPVRCLLGFLICKVMLKH